MTTDQIRAVFLAAGFTIKDGQTDLKPYVYEAAEALLAAYRAERAAPAVPMTLAQAAKSFPSGPFGPAHVSPVVQHEASRSPDVCRKCGGQMRPGVAMGQTVYTGTEGTCSPAGPGYVRECSKCSVCGWSVSTVDRAA